MSDHDVMNRPSTPALFADALSQLTALVETELRLVRTELSEKVSTAITAVITIAVAAVFLLAALFMILFGLAHLLIAFNIPPWEAFMIVGLVIALMGIVALFVAKRNLSAERLAPRRIMAQVSKDADIVRDQMR